MDLSILITTLNRTADLADCLTSLCNQTQLPTEIVIVDNGPSRETAMTVERYSGILPVRYLAEPRRGVSYARNLALSSARGEIVGFTDDDCVLDSHWVAHVLASFKGSLAIDVVVGRSLNHFPWSIAAQASYFFYRKWFDSSENNFDTKNIAFRKAIVSEMDLHFESQFSSFGCGEDITFGQQILDKNRTFHFNKEMVVSHKEPTHLSRFHRARYQRGRMHYYLKNVRKSNINLEKNLSVSYARLKRELLKELASEFGATRRLGFLMCVGSGYIAQKIGYYSEWAAYKVRN